MGAGGTGEGSTVVSEAIWVRPGGCTPPGEEAAGSLPASPPEGPAAVSAPQAAPAAGEETPAAPGTGGVRAPAP